MNFFQLDSNKVYTAEPEPSRFPMHIHNDYELFYFLSGSVKYSVEGNIYTLIPGDIIVLRNNEAHHPIPKKSVPYTRLFINFKPDDALDSCLTDELLTAFVDRPAGLYNHYSNQRFPDNHWYFYLNAIHEASDNLKKQFLLMSLLLELKEYSSQLKEESPTHSTSDIYQITQYIDKHLKQHLSLEMLCERFFISPTQLNRYFKRNLGTTAGEYISTKRLLLANDLIMQGQKPSYIFKQCGFNDYSTFYRAYKKKFGHAPKET